jgi:hypothetical protein
MTLAQSRLAPNDNEGLVFLLCAKAPGAAVQGRVAEVGKICDSRADADSDRLPRRCG